jgi:hypothetical protein
MRVCQRPSARVHTSFIDIRHVKILSDATPPPHPTLKAVEVYTDMGRLNMAARQLKEIAEAQEKQGLREEAITFYAQVGGWMR